MHSPEDPVAPFRAGSCLALALVAWFSGSAFFGCTQSEYPDRDPLVIDRAPVDSLEFLPVGSRFILEDSLSGVLFRGFHLGYVCTRITTIELERLGSIQPPRYMARLGLKLPSEPTCALDSVARDSVLMRRFTAADGPTVTLTDSLGFVLDTAEVARGILLTDSLLLVAPAVSAFHGRFFFRDTVGSLSRILSADSLSSCEYLNHAEYRKNGKGDTTTVTFTWLQKDVAASPDSCKGPTRRDALVPMPARPRVP